MFTYQNLTEKDKQQLLKQKKSIKKHWLISGLLVFLVMPGIAVGINIIALLLTPNEKMYNNFSIVIFLGLAFLLMSTFFFLFFYKKSFKKNRYNLAVVVAIMGVMTVNIERVYKSIINYDVIALLMLIPFLIPIIYLFYTSDKVYNILRIEHERTN